MRNRIMTLLTGLALGVTTLAVAPGAAPPAAADGYLNVRLSNTSDGRVLVRWDLPAGQVDHFKVATAASRHMDARPWSDNVGGTVTRLVVDHRPGVTPASGAYTFVELTAYMKNGDKNDTRTTWIRPEPASPPAGADRVKVATFNVRTWGADRSQRAWNSWTHRRARVARSMVNSGAGVFLLQEASGSPKLRVSGRRWQYQDLLRLLPDRYNLARRATYKYHGRTRGAQGNRIIYDASRYAKRDAGYFRMPGGTIRANRWVPWVLLRSKQTGSEFYAMSMHFKSGDDRPGSYTYFRIRQTQAARMVSKAQALANHGRTVYAGGDFNSTSNSLPYNGVQQAFMDAGFYDGFSAQHHQRAVPHDQRLPVPGQGAALPSRLRAGPAPEGPGRRVRGPLDGRFLRVLEPRLQLGVLGRLRPLHAGGLDAGEVRPVLSRQSG